jgi:hypothetical protein
VIPLFYKTTILSTFDKWFFKTPLSKLSKGDVMSPLVSEKSTKALLLYLKHSFLLDHGMITIEHLINYCF